VELHRGDAEFLIIPLKHLTLNLPIFAIPKFINQKFRRHLKKYSMNNKLLLSILLFFLLFQNISRAQDQPSMITALNSYVHYTNESIHGMLIVHRLLENFNQEVNKYVNLQSNQLNFYANKDLPKNIFVDPEMSFYKISPYRWYEVVKSESRSLNPSDARRLNKSADQLKSIMNRTNNVRFEIENFIKNNDLTKKENQKIIYEKLEGCVQLYHDFYKEKENLRKNLFDIYSNSINQELTRTTVPIQSLLMFQRKFLAFSSMLRFKTSDDNNNTIKNLRKSGGDILSISVKHPFMKKAKEATQSILSQAESFVSNKSISNEYQLYGSHYFYHNVELTSSFNSYGLGFVKNANKYIKNMHPTGLLLIEEPHFFKVIYAEEALEFAANKSEGQGDIINELPTIVNDREVIVRQQSIDVDSLELELAIYDHKQIDGDIISINFNGKWILESHKLTKQWLKIKIKLNEQGENYLLLHAENLGHSPPNTAAIRYKYQGKAKKVVLNSNLNESEMIKLNYSKSR